MAQKVEDTPAPKRREVLIGADPEVFVRHPKNGQFLSAHGMPGRKQNPFKTEFGALQVDGCALEFNINPAGSKKEFLRNLDMTYRELEARLKERMPDAELAVTPFAEFHPEYFKKLPKWVKQLGCEPDYDAYTLDLNDPPRVVKPVRCAGGHVHIGWAEDMNVYDLTHTVDCATVTQQLDHSLFLGSLLFDPDNRRRELYGKPGAFRPKPYGCEYRVLSNAWLRSPSLAAWVYDTTIVAMRLLSQGVRLYEDDYLSDLVKQAREDAKFYLDRDEHETAYWMLVGLDFPQLPIEEYGKMEASA